MRPDPPPHPVRKPWRTAAVAVTGIALLVGVGVLSWRDGYAAAVASRPMTDEDIAAKCRERYTDLNPHLTGEPVQRFVARAGDEQARVYVSEIDNWMIVCRKDSIGVWTLGTVMEAGAGNGIELFGAEDSVLKAGLVVGRVPEGTTTIRARLGSGRTVGASHDGDVFVVWLPGDAGRDAHTGDSLRGARLTATRADGSVAAVATAPADF